MNRVLIALSGLLPAQFLDRVLHRLSWESAELYLLHVVDTRPLDEYGLAASGLPGRGGKAAGRLRQMGALGAEAGQTMLAEAEAFTRSRVPAGTAIRRVQRTGIPEHEIIAAAHEIGAGLIALLAAEDPHGPPPPPLPPPGRVGRPAPQFPRRHLSPPVRFVVDHAPCDVLLLYLEDGRTT